MESPARFGVTSSEIIVHGVNLPVERVPRAAAGRSRPSALHRALHCDEPPLISIVDDNAEIRTALRDVFEDGGYMVDCYASGAEFLEVRRPGGRGCLLVDANMPDMSGIELIRHIRSTGDEIPVIVISRHAKVALAVQAMRAGAFDFIEKPIRYEALLATVEHALAVARRSADLSERRRKSAYSIASLTSKQAQILDLVLAGHPSKNIAADLGISQRTVDNHRAAIMRKTGSKSISALIQTAICAHCIADHGIGHIPTIAASPRRLPAIDHVRPGHASIETPTRGRSIASIARGVR